MECKFHENFLNNRQRLANRNRLQGFNLELNSNLNYVKFCQEQLSELQETRTSAWSWEHNCSFLFAIRKAVILKNAELHQISAEHENTHNNNNNSTSVIAIFMYLLPEVPAINCCSRKDYSNLVSKHIQTYFQFLSKLLHLIMQSECDPPGVERTKMVTLHFLGYCRTNKLWKKNNLWSTNMETAFGSCKGYVRNKGWEGTNKTNKKSQSS